MIAGVSWVWWAGFHVVVVLLLVGDWLLPGHRRETRHAQAFAWLGTALLVLAAAAFAGWIALVQGRQTALEFVAGYTIETSLSIDNLFVFMVLFQGFRISPQRQHKALLWGMGGAVLLRGLFIVAGVTLLKRFGWVTLDLRPLPSLCGLPAGAGRLGAGGHSRLDSAHATRQGIPAAGDRCRRGHRSAVRGRLHSRRSRRSRTIPSLSTHRILPPLLGLRSLYFALAAMLDRFRYLHYGLGALLGFVALKMLAARWVEVPITISLAVIGVVLAVCGTASVMAKGREQGTGNRD